MVIERGPSQPQASYATSAIIAVGLIMGQVLFAAVSWWLHSTGKRTGTDAPAIMHYVWLAVAIGGLAGANMVRQRLSAAADSPTERLPDATVQTQVVMMWALVEAGGLLGIVLHLLTGKAEVLYSALGYIFVCAVFFFPRKHWFSGTP